MLGKIPGCHEQSGGGSGASSPPLMSAAVAVDGPPAHSLTPDRRAQHNGKTHGVSHGHVSAQHTHVLSLIPPPIKHQLGVHRAGTGCGVHCSYGGTAEDTEAWERPEGAPLLPCNTGDSAPGQARYSFPTLPHSTLAQGRWPGVFRLSPGIGLQAPGNRPTLHCHLQMAKGRPRGGKGTSSPPDPRPSSSPQQTGLLVSFTGGGSDFSKTV